MKNVKNYDEFINESIIGFLSILSLVPIIFVVFGLYRYLGRFDYVDGNIIKSIKRWWQIVKTMDKYKDDIYELNDNFKNDKNLKKMINNILKNDSSFTELSIGDSNLTSSSTYASMLKYYILNNVNKKDKKKVEKLFDDIINEIEIIEDE